jgi:hypothetical protein
MSAKVNVKPFVQIFDRFGRRLSFLLFKNAQMDWHRPHKPSALNREEHEPLIVRPLVNIAPSQRLALAPAFCRVHGRWKVATPSATAAQSRSEGD